MRKTREQLDAEMGLADTETPVVQASSGRENRSQESVGPEAGEEGQDKDGQASPQTGPGTTEDGKADEETSTGPDGTEGQEVAKEAVDDAEGQDLTEPLLKRLVMVVESMLFVSGEPMTAKSILAVLRQFHDGVGMRQLRVVLDRLRTELREHGRGIRLAEVARGYQLRTPPECAPYLKKMVTKRPPRMTRATLETLAIVAYQQPITRAEVEQIRGVDCGQVLRQLLEKGLLKIIGRKDEPGRPLLYGTTDEFLKLFSLRDLASLPTLKDFAELADEAEEEAVAEQQKTDEQLIERLQEVAAEEFAPPGDDEVVRDLAEAMAEVSRRDRTLRKKVLAELSPNPVKSPQENLQQSQDRGEDRAPQPAEGDKTMPDGQGGDS